MHVLLFWSACWCAIALALAIHDYKMENAADYFQEFISKYNKRYANEHEKLHRFEIFKINLEAMLNLNKDIDSAVYGITQFFDLSTEEFVKKHTGFRSFGVSDEHCDMLGDDDIPDVYVPESFDWRNRQVVTPVKDQGNCGSCWAFSTAAYLESQYAIKTNILVSLSEQEIVNCDQISDGCCGGVMARALNAIKNVGGLVLEEDYPYQAEKGECEVDQSKVMVRVANCSSYMLNSQEKVKQLLYTTGPLIIAIKATALSRYEGGIISDEHCDVGGINHAVLLVGYGTENNKPYWTFKNSWGKAHGHNGYVKMERSNNPNSGCGMMNQYMTTAGIE